MAMNDVESARSSANEGSGDRRFREEFAVAGNQVFDKVKELIHQGNIRRIVVKHEGKTMVEFPLTVGVAGVLLAPQFIALGLAAAILPSCAVEVHRAD